MRDNYAYLDSRMVEVRARAHKERVDDLVAEVWGDAPFKDSITLGCTECGGIVGEDIVYVDANGDFYCAACIEAYSPLEEEGRVPEEFRVRVTA